MITAIQDFFIVSWQMLSDDAWWALLFSTIGEQCLKGLLVGAPYIYGSVFSSVLALMFGIYYAVIRSMHRYLWARWYSMTAASVLAVIPAAMTTLAVASYFAQERINSTIDNWGTVMKANPQCWATDAAADFERRLSKAGAQVETRDGRSYVRLATPNDPNGSLAEGNSEAFDASAKALAGMVTDAFNQDFPTFSPFVQLNTDEAVTQLAYDSYSFWSQPPTPQGEGEGNTDIITREYSGEALAPFVDAVTAKAHEATPHVAYSMMIFTIFVSLLCMLPGIAVIFFDLDKQIRMALRD